MFKWLRFSQKPTGTPSSSSKSQVGLAPAVQSQQLDLDEEAPLYPPADRGIPMEPLEKVLHRQRDLIERIQRAAGVSPEAFDARYMAPITNLASYVHLLPATDTEYFVGAGGLIRLSLEIGLHSLQTSHASVFPVAGVVEKRSALLPKWELATFLAAICSQLYRPVANMVVIDGANNQWPQILMPLTEWGGSLQTRRYFIRWATGTDTASRQSCAAFLIGKIIPAEVLQYLNEDNNVIVPAMTASISGGDMNPSQNPIGRIVAPIMTRVIQEDMKRNSRNYGNYSLGIHLEPHLIDAMRRLIKNGQWTINVKGARVWIGTDGVYIIWSAGAKDIAALLTADSFVGLPQDPDTLADILIEAKVLERNPKQGRYWTITLPESGTLIDNAVRLANESLIFPVRFDLASMRTSTLTVAAGPVAPLTSLPQQAPSSAAPPETTESRPKPKPKAKKDVAAPPDATKAPVVTAISKADDQVEPQTQATRPTEGTDDKSLDGLETRSGALPNIQTEQAPNVVAEGVQEVVATQNDKHSDPELSPKTTDEEAKVTKEKTNRAMDDAGGDEGSTKLLAKLSRETQWITKQILKAQQKGTLTGVVASLETGLAISAEELSAHGMPTTDLLNDYASRNWLWTDKAKPLRKIHKVELNGKMESVIIIRADIAVALGFTWTPPEEKKD
jgi:conjugal transfer pilus assembly protein TraI